MVPNLKSARKAIEAELSHARQGIAYYSARVEALEIALHQLENVEHVEAPPSGGTKPQAGAKAGTAGRARKAYRAKGGDGAKRVPATNGARRHRRKEAKNNAGEDALPQTGADFWFGLVSEQPQSAVDIANAAITALDIKPEQKTQIQKLKQRVSPALANLLSAQKIRDTGAGRERRFFRAA